VRVALGSKPKEYDDGHHAVTVTLRLPAEFSNLGFTATPSATLAGGTVNADTASAHLGASEIELEFHAASWDVPQAVTIVGADDDVCVVFPRCVPLLLPLLDCALPSTCSRAVSLSLSSSS
jgi:hypothetical protein